MLIDLLRTRRSIRRFEPRQVEREKVDLLIEAALRAPTSRGRTPWHFIVVEEASTIGLLAAAKPEGAAFVRGAPLVVVVCADTSVTDVWVEDASIAATIVHLQAHDLGLGSCWVQIRLRPHDEEETAAGYLATLLGLPPDTTVEAMIAIGYPAEAKEGRSSSSLRRDKVSQDRYGRRRDETAV